MFTIKLYKDDGNNVRIIEGEAFTILRMPARETEPVDARAEITVHVKSGEDVRYDIGGGDQFYENVPIYQMAIIENGAGRTTEIIGTLGPRGLPIKPGRSAFAPAGQPVV